VADSGNNRVIHFLKAASSTNAATNQPSVPVALGGQVILSGGGLADDTSTVAQGAAWPLTMLNRQVVINDMVPSPLYSVGPTQISFQFPSNVPVGSDRVAVRLADTGELIAGGTILAAASSPGLFTTNKLGTGQAVAVNQVVKRDGVYYAFYHANSRRPWADWTTCVARSRDLVHWEKYQGNPIIANNRSSGVLVEGPSGTFLYTMHPEVCVFRGPGAAGSSTHQARKP